MLAVIAWREIYSYLEKCADACEHAADVVESVDHEKFIKDSRKNRQDPVSGRNEKTS